MIQLTCTHCKAVLEMDEAFAGGVCRCQYCGTIQTVPAHLKHTAVAAAPASAQPAAASRSLYQGRGAGAPGAMGSGLDQLADVVASSSGLSNSGLRRGPRAGAAVPSPVTPGRPTQPAAKPAKGGNPTMLIVAVAGGVVIVALVSVILWMVFGGNGDAPAKVASPDAATNKTPAPPVKPRGSDAVKPPPVEVPPAPLAGPNFFGIPLTGQKVVYVLDRGDATRQAFDPMKAGLYKSLDSLGGDREFQVLFWKKSNDSLSRGAFPKKGTAKATPDQLEQCRKQVDDVYASGATQVDEAIREAVKVKPSDIVIATAKGSLLDDSMVGVVTKALGGQKIPVHTLALGERNGSAVLKSIAQKTGGVYREVSDADLRSP